MLDIPTKKLYLGICVITVQDFKNGFLLLLHLTYNIEILHTLFAFPCRNL